MTAIDYDPWIEPLIATGRLAPGARGLSRRASADQHNQANALDTADDDYLYSPGQAQDVARAALSMVGIDIADGTRILLTDGTAGNRGRCYLANCGQIESAIEEHRLTTGENLAVEPILQALPWA